ncbi:Odorant-binding protein 56g-5 [Drosophila willistoni]|uniref:Odorant-binding protein 56g-5 n=1 Tax=Drosophila willistoni TaxID=7260 RepID=B4MRU5_DROWI|nr:general odorant-binding protein 56h [Drosophila willistoni]EDW74834.1 Odorant-binding protein 56g-5 [Drosophila willistoni]
MRAILALTLLLSYLTNVLVASETPDIGKLTNTCMTEHGVTIKDFADLKSGATKPEDASDNIKCATQCLVVKLGFMDEESNILTENVKAKFDSTPMENTVMEALSKCGGIKGVNPCDTAFQIMNCLQPIAS